MKVIDLLSGLRYRLPVSTSRSKALEAEARSVVVDSRSVEEGDLYLAMPSASGKEILPFMGQAVKRGAVALVCSEEMAEKFLTVLAANPSEIDPEAAELFELDDIQRRLIVVLDMGRARARIAANLNPGQPAHIAAVTGTNGKTSSVHFFGQLCQALGKKGATLGTLGLSLPPEGGASGSEESFLGSQQKTTLTSPDPFVLHRILQGLSDNAVPYLALEASSHGLAQKRLEAVDLEVGAFTNLSHDHLDYHHNMESYFKAKERLFRDLLKPGFTAVINMDDRYGPTLERLCQERRHRLIRYGRGGEELKILDITLDEGGQTLDLRLFGAATKVRLPLIGVFQAYNVLCALGMAVGVGLKGRDLVPFLETLRNVPGRLELVGYTKEGGAVFVDYAHTPDALESVLTSLKPHVKGLLSLVFGCGGDRDALKRPIMGQIAHRHSQKIYVTDDNPRDEDPSRIRQEIVKSCPDAFEIGDRYQAIEASLKGLSKGSACVIAGKGHETGQLVAGKQTDFDDREVARDILRAKGGTPV